MLNLNKDLDDQKVEKQSSTFKIYVSADEISNDTYHKLNASSFDLASVSEILKSKDDSLPFSIYKSAFEAAFFKFIKAKTRQYNSEEDNILILRYYSLFSTHIYNDKIDENFLNLNLERLALLKLKYFFVYSSNVVLTTQTKSLSTNLQQSFIFLLLHSKNNLNDVFDFIINNYKSFDYYFAASLIASVCKTYLTCIRHSNLSNSEFSEYGEKLAGFIEKLIQTNSLLVSSNKGDIFQAYENLTS